MNKLLIYVGVSIILSSAVFGQNNNEAECEAHSEDYVTGQQSTTIPSYLSLDLLVTRHLEG